MKLKKVKTKTVGQLKKILDVIFSRYIRLRDKFVCFTCGAKLEMNSSQNGHYVSRRFNSLRYDERNCHCQCVACNVFRKGAMDEYALALVRKYGKGILEELNKEKRKTKQFSRPELENLIEVYKEKIKELEA